MKGRGSEGDSKRTIYYICLFGPLFNVSYSLQIIALYYLVPENRSLFVSNHFILKQLQTKLALVASTTVVSLEVCGSSSTNVDQQISNAQP